MSIDRLIIVRVQVKGMSSEQALAISNGGLCRNLEPEPRYGAGGPQYIRCVLWYRSSVGQ